MNNVNRYYFAAISLVGALICANNSYAQADIPDVPTTVNATISEDGDVYINIEKDLRRAYISENGDLYLALSAGFDVFSINLKSREYKLGAVPGVGYGLKYSPEWWTITPVLFALDVYASAGLVQNVSQLDGVTTNPSFFAMRILAQVTIADWIGVGFGPDIEISLNKGVKDQISPVLTLGVRKDFSGL